MTLRIYDYKRLGLDGKPRQLHVTEALEAIRFGGDPGHEFEGDMRADAVTPLAKKSAGQTLLLPAALPTCQMHSGSESLVIVAGHPSAESA